MTAEGWQRLSELFDEALELPPPERAAWLEGLEGADARLRPRLEAWLRDQERAREFLAVPLAPGASWERESSPPHEPGTVLGGYRLLRVIGFGGTSVVYEAEQDEPRRAVALKVFQIGLASDRARERFREEARILASLRHPAIAQVYGAGTETAGATPRPWMAMELVRGARPIDRYARAEGLALLERLELFARVCDAVAHGHQRGVIHRDLKPANLLVDAAGEPKVIDFGLAKVLGTSAPASAAATGGLFGTLAWMSPERLGGDPGPVDTRADVYALGVVLFELLFGAPPHDLEPLALEEAVRVVRTAAPRRPPGARQVDGDLDAIVHTALAKDPDARYRTAGELAADLRRYLAREPVVARRPSLAHQLRLTLVRHRRASVAAATVAVLLAGAALLGTLRAARVEARERAKAQEVTDFLKSVLALASPSVARRADLTMVEVLDDASRRIHTELADVPQARAELHAVVGSAWRELGELDRAEAHLRASAAVLRDTRPASAALAGALSMLSEVLLAGGRGREAEAVLHEARALYSEIPDQPEFYLGIVTNKLAEARRQQGDLASAEELARRALAIYRRAFGERHVAVAAALHNLASIQRDRGAFAGAEQGYRAALSIQRAATGDDSLATARARLALAEALAVAERPRDASGELAEARPVLERLLPERHADRARAAALERRIAGGE